MKQPIRAAEPQNYFHHEEVSIRPTVGSNSGYFACICVVQMPRLRREARIVEVEIRQKLIAVESGKAEGARHDDDRTSH